MSIGAYIKGWRLSTQAHPEMPGLAYPIYSDFEKRYAASEENCFWWDCISHDFIDEFGA